MVDINTQMRINIVVFLFLCAFCDFTEEPLAANGNHLGFEIYQYGGSNNVHGNSNGFSAFDYESSSININTDVYDYDQRYYDVKRHK